MQLALLVFITMAAGLVQSVTGFGSGVVMMLVLPTMLPVLGAAAVSTGISLGLNVYSTWVYRKNINWKLLVVPSLIYCVVSTAALKIAGNIEAGMMLKILGAFLILLSIYFLLFSERIHVKANMTTVGICSVISGIGSAWFGIGGPPMVLYYLSALERKEDYLGTIQAFFLITGLYTQILRIVDGIYTMDLFAMTVIGIVGILIGGVIGKRIVNKLPVAMMRKIVYGFLAITGVINLFS